MAYCFPDIASFFADKWKITYMKDNTCIFDMWVLAILVLMGINTSDFFFSTKPQFAFPLF